MSRKVKTSELEAERIRKQAAELAAVLSEQAHLAGKQARLMAEQGRTWATPRVEAAGAWAGPKVDKAWRDTVKATAPKVEAATERVRPAVDNAYERIVDDYLPRVSRAMHEAAEAAGKTEGLGAKAAVAGEAARRALTEPPKKSHGVAKTLGWVLVGTAAAGTGYLLWRRSQPIEDPWAEEYWDDTTVTAPAEPTGHVADTATTTGTATGTATTTASDATTGGGLDAGTTADDGAARAAEDTSGETDERSGKDTPGI